MILLKKDILVLYAGGTIGMIPTKNGLEPSKNTLISHLKNEMVDIVTTEKIIDSSQLNWELINEIVIKIRANQDKYKGFLIVQGTDTLAFTYHYLKFLLKDFKKPVVITGAMKPLGSETGEGEKNLKESLEVLRKSSGRELRAIVMAGETIERGTVTKISTESLMPYKAFNLSRESNHLEELLANNILLQDKRIDILIMQPAMVLHKSFAGDGLILLLYGSGTFLESEELIALLEFFGKNKPILLLSQALENQLDLNLYSASKGLKKLKLFNGSGYSLEEGIAFLHIYLSQSNHRF